MVKKILSVGYQLATEKVEYSTFSEKVSLLDWDIILFQPDISGFFNSYSVDYYQGKRSLNDNASFRLKEACEHWRRELSEAVSNGKTVIVHLSPPEEFFVGTGSKSVSGTGRNQKVTRHVEAYTSYQSLPALPRWTIARGAEMVIAQSYRGILAPYWERFKDVSDYEVVFEAGTKGGCISTRRGEKPVGLMLQSKSSDGTLLMLPDIDFAPENFFEERDDEYFFNEEARRFAAQYLSEVVNLDSTLRSESERTPQPDWALAEEYKLAEEVRLLEELLKVEAELEEAQRKKEAVASNLDEASQLRGLLFESGKPLEAAILKALRILGFKAENHDDGTSEFDAIFESEEGRLLGEAEGKDSKPIAISKLRQLSVNIHEDLEREEVAAPAKGILFGNAFRLSKPADREEHFTQKCISSAQTMSIGLVPTQELFRVARYLSEAGDEVFAKKVRLALINGIGPIEFPAIPKRKAKPKVEDSANGG